MAPNMRWKQAQILRKKRLKDKGKYRYIEPPLPTGAPQSASRIQREGVPQIESTEEGTGRASETCNLLALYKQQ